VRILLAEDDRNYGKVLKNELEEDKYTVDWVIDGVQAVLQFLETPYGAVLLDLKMPRMDGNDALRILKKINPGVRVITFSGTAGEAERKESMGCGALHCLSKPFPISLLKQELRDHLRE
jgi:two-component system, OmpR family, response regulator QseB